VELDIDLDIIGGVLFSDSVRDRVCLKSLAPPIMSIEGELDVNLHPLDLQGAASLKKELVAKPCLGDGKKEI